MSTNEGMNLPEIDINLEDESVRAWGGNQGPLLPVGAYTFDISAVEQSTSKSNQPTLKVTFKVADEGEFFGVELTKSYSLQQKALGRVKNLMMAAGCRLDKIRPAELLGARIIAEIAHTPGQPKLDAQGNVTEGSGVFCDVVKEQAVQQAEPEPPPPPAANGKAPAARRA
jgi:hypothetical protein